MAPAARSQLELGAKADAALQEDQRREDTAPSAHSAAADPLGDPAAQRGSRIRLRLIEQARTLVRESGNTGPFDAEAWVDRWLRRPNHALGGARPELYLNTPNGEELLSGLIGAMASGAYL